MFGEVWGENGKPVLAVLELEPTNFKGLKMNNIVLASTYGKDNAQSLINRSRLLYVDANKKRTTNWLRSNRLQLPLFENQYGSISTIAFSEDKVNGSSRNFQNHKEQEASQRAQVKAQGSLVKKFSIKEENGQKYVQVDTDQELFDGLNGVESLKKAKQYIVEHFKGQYIGKGNARAYVSGRTAKEYSRPASRRINEAVKTAKGRVATELDNLLSASSFLSHEIDDGGHPEAIGGWDYYRTAFRIGDKTFTGVINILNGDGFRTLHDITNIKEKDIQSIRSGHEAEKNDMNVNPTAARNSDQPKPQGRNKSVASTNGTSAHQSRSGLPVGVPGAESTGGNNSISKSKAQGKGILVKNILRKRLKDWMLRESGARRRRWKR